MMNFKIANGILIWDDGSCRSATDEEVQLQANLDATKKANAYLHECHSNWSADAIRWKNKCEALQAEVERLKSAPSHIIEVLKKLKDDAETTSKENPPTDDCGGEFDAIWMNDLNGLIEEATWQFQEQAND